ncbi:ankyrin repeat domain-containing protein 34B-like [Mytilus edulis]|uniref:ankyrin repeat domain-containing protein 34B-like n=1 Tax=Mytilus edulis TaxID=6550 RepID=UPI0039F0A166
MQRSMYARRRSSLEEEQLIIDKLFAAIVLKKFKLARILAEGGANVSAKLSSGVTTLMAACDAVTGDCHLEKKYGLIKCLIKNGAKVNECDMFQRTALHYACINGNKETIQILEEHGADTFALDINGKTPYFYLDYNSNIQKTHVPIRRDSIATNSIENFFPSLHRWDSRDFLNSL